jgi:glycosyltransferase involved in cell wall biosynthesis
MTTVPLVTFIIPVRNDAQRLSRCLASIARNGHRPGEIEVLVADNGSTDGSGTEAQRQGARVLSLPGDKVAALRNRSARDARSELLAFIDADHEIDPNWLAAVADVMADGSVTAAGAPYESPADGTWVQRTYDGLRRHPATLCETEWLPSGNLVVRRSAFMAVGGFDTSLDTCEDVDFCRRLRLRGHRIVSDPRLKSVHLGDPRSLGALFRAELWRGRDNLRASLRGRLTVRELPSLAIPVVDLALLITAGAGLATVSVEGLMTATAALTSMLALASLRTGVIVGRLRPITPARAVQAFAVALVYDAARAMALVARSGHAVRRRE